MNYIRHKLTSYGSFVEKLFNQIGTSEMFLMLNRTVYDKIAEVYPDYADECNRQKMEKEMQSNFSPFEK